MDKVEDIVGRLRDKSAHSAEAYGLEEYMPMAKFWKSYADLSAEAADLIQSQQALIEEMREALWQAQTNEERLLKAVNACDLAPDQKAFIAKHLERTRPALSQKDQIDG